MGKTISKRENLMRRGRVFLAALLLSGAAVAASGLSALTSAESTDGLKSALNQAVNVAVGNLGKADGFMGNPEVKIPLPGKLAKAGKTLRRVGLGKQSDALTLAMNRAAEAAVPEAKALFVDSIKQMSVTDALSILRGPENAATLFFQKSMSTKLTERFLPIVGKATANVQLAQRYNELAGKASTLGLVDQQDANLDGYVTRKALDGLFLTMAKEEAAIRKNPMGQASSLLQKVFGALSKK
jgi:Protein of unknown function (DUF4197)